MLSAFQFAHQISSDVCGHIKTDYPFWGGKTCTSTTYKRAAQFALPLYVVSKVFLVHLGQDPALGRVVLVVASNNAVVVLSFIGIHKTTVA